MGVSTQRGAGVNRLTDAKVRVFADRRGSASKKKLFDRSGRFLTHTKAGTATWRVKYRLRVRKMKRKEAHRDHTIYLGPTITFELRAWRDRMGARA